MAYNLRNKVSESSYYIFIFPMIGILCQVKGVNKLRIEIPVEHLVYVDYIIGDCDRRILTTAFVLHMAATVDSRIDYVSVLCQSSKQRKYYNTRIKGLLYSVEVD